MIRLNKFTYAFILSLSLSAAASADKILPIFKGYKSANTEKVQACESLKRFIQEYISIVTYCNKTEDCSTSIAAPFSCYVSVRKSDEEEVRGTLSSYDKLCLDFSGKCPPATLPECVNNQCTIK